MPFITLVLLLLAGLAGSAAPGPVERTVYVMGTTLQARVDCAGAAGAEAAEAAVRAVEGVEALLSTWRDTPLRRANLTPVGESSHVPRELAELLAEAGTWAERTGHAFDPAVGPLVAAWDLRGAGRRPSASELHSALDVMEPGSIRVDPRSATLTRLREGAWIDAGGFGKGAALRAAGDTLSALGVTRAIVNLGGQILALAGADEAPWDVAVAHPNRRGEPVVWLRLARVSAATSGNSERGIDVDGARLGHLLDPRTGFPAPDWGSVTIVAPDPMVADILSTALYVMGPEAGLSFVADTPDVGALFLVRSDDQVQTLHNRAMERWLATSPATAGPTMTLSPERRMP